MFTGIVAHCGIVKSIESRSMGKRLYLSCEFEDLQEGESISVNGVCLTATQVKPKQFACDLSPETLELSTLKHTSPGDKVNLERALRPWDRMGGHYVNGHVDQMASVQSINIHGDFVEMRFQGCSEEAKKFLIKKGSVAINGVSLTLNEIVPNGFTLMLIPQTLAMTNLSDLKEKDSVNVEYDMMAKLVANYMQLAKDVESL